MSEPMSNPAFNPEQIEMLLDAYLAGELAGAELAGFEAAMAADARLREQVELQRRINTSLKATFVPPKMETPTLGLVSGTGEAAPTAKEAAAPGEVARSSMRIGPRKWVWYAAAAGLLLGVFVGVRVYVGNPEEKIVAPDFAYRMLDRTGWKPAFVCTTSTEFAALVKKQLGEALIPAANSTAVLVGWGYSSDYEGSPLSSKTMMLLTTVEKDRVLVLIDKKRNDRAIRVPEGGPLKMFKREVGGLILYEITPRESPQVIDKLEQP